MENKEKHIAEHKRHMANFCMLTFMVDHYNGELPMDTATIKRAFNGENDAVKAELPDGEIVDAIDVRDDKLEGAIFEWKERNPEEFREILLEMK